MVRRVEDRSGGKTCFRGAGGQTLQPAAVQLDIAVQDRDPLASGGAPAAIDGAGEPGIFTHLNDPAARGSRDFRRAVGGGIVDNHDLIERQCLFPHGVQQALQQIGAIVNGDDCRE